MWRRSAGTCSGHEAPRINLPGFTSARRKLTATESAPSEPAESESPPAEPATDESPSGESPSESDATESVSIGSPPSPAAPSGGRFRPPARAGLLIGALLGLLGFALAVQLQSTQGSTLESARQEDLVRILDDLSAREDRLRGEIADQEAARNEISSGSNRSDAALDQVRKRADELGVLAGTVPARGPGVVVTVREGSQKLPADLLLDALEELRGAGVEAVAISGSGISGQTTDVRVGTSTWFADRGEGIAVDGTSLTAPYKITAIGDGPTIAAALNIPGGVIDSVRRASGSVQVDQHDEVTITSLRPLKRPQYARPAK